MAFYVPGLLINESPPLYYKTTIFTMLFSQSHPMKPQNGTGKYSVGQGKNDKRFYSNVLITFSIDIPLKKHEICFLPK